MVGVRADGSSLTIRGRRDSRRLGRVRGGMPSRSGRSSRCQTAGPSFARSTGFARDDRRALGAVGTMRPVRRARGRPGRSGSGSGAPWRRVRAPIRARVWSIGARTSSASPDSETWPAAVTTTSPRSRSTPSGDANRDRSPRRSNSRSGGAADAARRSVRVKRQPRSLRSCGSSRGCTARSGMRAPSDFSTAAMRSRMRSEFM